MTTVAVLGGGNGGFAAAAHLTLTGHSPRLYNRSAGTIAAIRDREGIEYSGVIGDGFAPIDVITTDLEQAVTDVDLIMVCLPAPAFEGLAHKLAPLLDGETPILLNPGSTGGALAVRDILTTESTGAIPPIAETNTLTYIARKQADDHVHVSSVVDHVRCGVVPASERNHVLDLVRSLYPSVESVENVIHTALCNVNAVVHPPGMVLSAAWIEATEGDFRFYYDAGTDAVANVMAAIDEERLAIAASWDLNLEPFPRLFAEIGSTSQAAGESGSFRRMLRESEPNKFIRAPDSLDHRYVHEDIPYGLVPMQRLGQIGEVETPVIDSLVTVSSRMNERSYEQAGWSDPTLGLPDDHEQAIQQL